MILKKVLHNCEEKIQEKSKITQQKDENLVQEKQQCSVFAQKLFSNHDFLGCYGLLKVEF